MVRLYTMQQGERVFKLHVSYNQLLCQTPFFAISDLPFLLFLISDTVTTRQHGTANIIHHNHRCTSVYKPISSIVARIIMYIVFSSLTDFAQCLFQAAPSKHNFPVAPLLRRPGRGVRCLPRSVGGRDRMPRCPGSLGGRPGGARVAPSRGN